MYYFSLVIADVRASVGEIFACSSIFISSSQNSADDEVKTIQIFRSSNTIVMVADTMISPIKPYRNHARIRREAKKVVMDIHYTRRIFIVRFFSLSRISVCTEISKKNFFIRTYNSLPLRILSFDIQETSLVILLFADKFLSSFYVAHRTRIVSVAEQ